MVIDVSRAIEPKSDQLNADDFLAGPKTVRIRSVETKAAAEQPVWVHLEGHDGKPWKPCKTALRCLVALWGADASKWAGLSLTLYNDPDVTWGGVKCGGIRVSHMEGLDSPRSLMLTRTRGKKGATVIHPLVVEAAAPAPNNSPDYPEHLQAWKAKGLELQSLALEARPGAAKTEIAKDIKGRFSNACQAQNVPADPSRIEPETFGKIMDAWAADVTAAYEEPV